MLIRGAHLWSEREGADGVAKGFLALPHRLYRDDPRWIPEQPDEVLRAFSPANRWHEHGAAHTFCLPGRARAAVFLDGRAAIDGERAAFFGYWESAGELEADRALFRRVADWARARGATRLYGPINFSTAHAYRVLLSAEPDALPFPGEPYNPTWYGAQLAALGFALERRYLTQHIDRGRARASLDRHARLRQRLEARGYRFSVIDDGEWLGRLDQLRVLADAMFAGNLAYTPFGADAFSAAFGASLLRRLWRELSVIAHAPNGEIAGFFLVYPHYGPLVGQGAGAARIAPAALDYARDAAKLPPRARRCALLKTVAVSPKYRGRGVAEALSAWLLERSEPLCDELLGALIREDNASRRLSAGETPALRWYGLYSKAL